MTVETATYIDTLDPNFPPDSDPVSEGSAHLRLLKEVLQATFPNLTAAVTATAADINGAAARLTALEGNRARKDIAETFADDVTVTGDLSIGGNLTLTGTSNVVPAGVIAMWSGSIASIPAGWALCDGTNGTPDLRNRFIMGAGTVNPAVTGGANSLSFASDAGGSHTHTTVAAGEHSHGTATASHALTWAQMPAHAHDGSTQVAGWHQHGFERAIVATGAGNIATGSGVLVGITYDYPATGGDGSHQHYFVSNSAGGGAGHTHGISADGSHTHTVSTAADHTHTVAFDNRPAFYALAFIMKT